MTNNPYQFHKYAKQRLERKWEYNLTPYQLFTGFLATNKQLVGREILYNILIEFHIFTNTASTIRMCGNEVYIDLEQANSSVNGPRQEKCLITTAL
jgi:hypothetical protein